MILKLKCPNLYELNNAPIYQLVATIAAGYHCKKSTALSFVHAFPIFLHFTAEYAWSSWFFFCSLNPICTSIDLVHARRVSFFAIATPLPLVESAKDRIQATSNQEKQ